MTELRILNVIAWGLLLLTMLPGAWSASFGRDPRRSDPMRLALVMVSFVMSAGNLRFLFIPDSDGLWMAIYVLSLLTACFTLYLARTYGRGPRL